MAGHRATRQPHPPAQQACPLVFQQNGFALSGLHPAPESSLQASAGLRPAKSYRGRFSRPPVSGSGTPVVPGRLSGRPFTERIAR